MGRGGEAKWQVMGGGYLWADMGAGRRVLLEGVWVCINVVWRGVCGHGDSESGFVLRVEGEEQWWQFGGGAGDEWMVKNSVGLVCVACVCGFEIWGGCHRRLDGVH